MEVRSSAILFTTAPAEPLLRSLVDRLRSRWPSLSFLIDSLTENGWSFNSENIDECWKLLSQPAYVEVRAFQSPYVRTYFEEGGTIDHEMERAWLMIGLRPRNGVSFLLGSVVESESDEKTVGSVDPYSAHLCSPRLLEITLDLPSQSEIASEVLGWTIALCKSQA